MKKLLLASLFFTLPITAFAVPTEPEQFEKLENEFSALGLYLSSHPLEPFSKIIKNIY